MNFVIHGGEDDFGGVFGVIRARGQLEAQIFYLTLTNLLVRHYEDLMHMKLEKANETVWSIKYKENLGRFILRSTEIGGEVTRVAIALERGDEYLEFDMDKKEFQNFFGILTSFKDMVDNPQLNSSVQPSMLPELNTSRSSTQKSAPFQPKARTPDKKSRSPPVARSEEQEIEDLIQNFAEEGEKPVKLRSPHKTRREPPPADLSPEENPDPKPETLERRREMLRETDWDPW